jgi:hypothetical protein
VTVQFQHPLNDEPYSLLEYVRTDGHGTPLYRVKGSKDSECGAYEALGKAFRLKGGSCFYCDKHFKPQPLDERTAHRDHVLPIRNGGEDWLHNLVIACAHCGRAKKADDIFDFRPSAAKRYHRALHQLVTRCVNSRPPDGSR